MYFKTELLQRMMEKSTLASCFKHNQRQTIGPDLAQSHVIVAGLG